MALSAMAAYMVYRAARYVRTRKVLRDRYHAAQKALRVMGTHLDEKQLDNRVSNFIMFFPIMNLFWLMMVVSLK
jgi:hypothetical protein